MSQLPIKTGHLFIGAAVLLGLITMVLFGTMSKPTHAPAPKAAEVATQPIVVPLIPISKGETLTSDKLKVVKWPKDFLPQGATFQTIPPLLGRVPLQDLLPGEPIFSQKLSSPDTNGLPALIPPGLRALTVGVTEVKGVAGFIKPGDRVDVLCTFTLSNSRGDGSRSKYYRTVTLTQDVMILASAQTMVEKKNEDVETPEGIKEGEAKTTNDTEATSEKDKQAAKDRRKKEEAAPAFGAPSASSSLTKQREEAEKQRREEEKRAKLVSSVTLAVNPVQAQQITLAEQAGDIRLVLRSASDIDQKGVPATESEDVVYPNKAARPTPPMSKMPKRPSLPPMLPPAPVGSQVELIQGTNKTSVQF